MSLASRPLDASRLAFESCSLMPQMGACLLKNVVLLSAALVLALPQMASADVRPGPAASAVKRWFTTDRSLNCFDRQGNPSGCRLDEDSHVTVSYAPSGSIAVAFATYVNDPTGNAEMFAAAVFRKEQDGWRFVRTVPNLSGKSATNVAFTPGGVSFDTEVWRKGDGHCCPTGRKRWTVALP